MTTLWYCLGVLLVAALPISRLFSQLFFYLRRVAMDLSGPHDRVVFSWSPVWAILAHGLTVAKGGVLLFLVAQLEDPILLAVSAILLIVGQYVGLFLDFRGRYASICVLFGSLLFVSPLLACVALLLFLLFAAVLDDMRIGFFAVALGTWLMAASLSLDSMLVGILFGSLGITLFLDGQFMKPLSVSVRLRQLSESPWR